MQKVIFKGRLGDRETQGVIGGKRRGEGSHHGRPAVSCRRGRCAHLRGDEAVDTCTGERAVHLWVMTHHCKWSSVGQRSPQCRTCTHVLIPSFDLPEYNKANVHKVLVKHRAAHHRHCIGNVCETPYPSTYLTIHRFSYPRLPCQGVWALGWA